MAHTPLRQEPFYCCREHKLPPIMGDQFYYIALLWYLLIATQSPSTLVRLVCHSTSTRKIKQAEFSSIDTG